MSEAIGTKKPARLPKSTPATISFRFICEILTHAVGRLETWRCCNGYCDTSEYGSGEREAWIASFPTVRVDKSKKKSLADGSLEKQYGYWFLLKDAKPELCLDIEGRLHKRYGQTVDLAALYAKHQRIWPVIAETALELLP